MSTFIIHSNEKQKEPFFIYDKICLGESNINVKEKFLKEKEKNKSVKNNNFQLILQYLENLEERIKNKFQYNYCLKLKLIFKKEKEENENNKDSITMNISCEFIFYDPINSKEVSFKEFKILENENCSESEGFLFFLDEINKEDFKNLTYKYEGTNLKKVSNNKIISSKISKSQEKENSNSNNDYYFARSIESKALNNNNKNNISTNISKKEQINIYPSKEKILVYIKNINKYRKSADSIRQISKSLFYSFGEENYIIIYDNNFDIKLKIENLDDKIYNVTKMISENDNQIEMIACCNKNINLININLLNFQYNIKQYQIQNLFVFYFCEIKRNNFIISGENLVMHFQNLFDINKESNSYKFSNKTFNSGIKISENIVALTSNSLIVNGEDSLIICNVETKKIENTISGYSYVSGKNGLGLMNIGNKKILLAGCKKYFSEQKNGILLIESPDNIKKIKEKFYDSDAFEVSCVCPIKDFNYKNNSQNNNLILAGGFDSEKGEGKIKLFQILKENEEKGYSLQYLQDIEFEDNDEFQGFEMTVTCITQSESTGNILITCLDGNVYLFSRPNLTFYLEED